MKQILKRVLYVIAPRSTTALMSARTRAHSHRVVASWGGSAVARKLVGRFGSRVQEGPFAGLILTDMAHAEQIGPYLLGVYESELDEAWDTVLRGTYTQIIDIGAKFGYYAVGLAKQFPDASVVAFDTDWWARKATRQMASANRAGNVGVKGYCSPEWLAQHAHAAALIISDCEGYEAELFSPKVISRLRHATLIIETHDCFVPGVSDGLQSAFGDTHVVRVYDNQGSRRGTTRRLDFLSESEQALAVQEAKPFLISLLCLPKTGPNKSLSLTGGT